MQNLTNEEFLSFANHTDSLTKKQLLSQLNTLTKEVIDLESQLKRVNKEIEVSEEQVNFAKDLIEEVYEIVSNSEEEAGDIIGVIARLINDSNFEL